MKAVWDKIYKSYLRGGEPYATLRGKILPQFRKFIAKSRFETKSALDIGCGTGIYLRYLKKKGFKVVGIDSSPAAIRMSKQLLGNKKIELIVADMFRFAIPKNRYDLIFSINALYHGEKPKIIRTLQRIYHALLPGGQIFITLPVYVSRKNWKNTTEWRYIRDGVTRPISGPEKGLIHTLFKKPEIKRIFSPFKKFSFTQEDSLGQKWIITATK